MLSSLSIDYESKSMKLNFRRSTYTLLQIYNQGRNWRFSWKGGEGGVCWAKPPPHTRTWNTFENKACNGALKSLLQPVRHVKAGIRGGPSDRGHRSLCPPPQVAPLSVQQLEM